MTTLQKALTANASCSSLSGLIMIVAHQQLANLFQVNNAMPFWIIGILLLFFAATIVIEIKQQRIKAVWWIIIQDLLWVAGSIILLLLQPWDISTIGNVMIGGMAALVFFFAYWQYQGIQVLKQTAASGALG